MQRGSLHERGKVLVGNVNACMFMYLPTCFTHYYEFTNHGFRRLARLNTKVILFPFCQHHYHEPTVYIRCVPYRWPFSMHWALHMKASVSFLCYTFDV